jgi:16S rRNA (uracil1498-N3)-methyltransferase
VRQIRLFTQQALISNASLELEPEPAHHLARVLRARVGDEVLLFNGDGVDWVSRVEAIEKRRVLVHIGTSVPSIAESPLSTHLGLCLSKGERFDWAIQKATELGVTHITPLLSTRVDVKLPADRLAKKLGHWQQVIIAACEQCGRSQLPNLHPPTDLKHWVTAVDADLKLVLHHHQIAALPEAAPREVALLVGPEGGLTDDEVEAACQQGFQRFRMGPRVLRTETAPAAALAIVGSRWGDL